MKRQIRRLVARWHRHRFEADLERCGDAELDVLLDWARLLTQYPRRWWFVGVWDYAWVMGL